MTTVPKASDTPKKKTARVNQRSIFETAQKHEGELPVKKSGGRKSLLAPIVEQLKTDPGSWYKVAHGKRGTIGQTRTRLAGLDSNLEVETRADENDDTQSFCFARYVAPKS